MEVDVSEWHIATGWNRYSEGTKYRHICHDSVICSQYIARDGIKHYEFFSAQDKCLIKDFSSKQMQDVDDILYFIKHEDTFKSDIDKEESR